MFLYIIYILCLLSTTVFAAQHYVRSDATGNNNGTDWNNAYTSLPSTLVRGDTYYVADGTYPNYTFDDAENGLSYIIIKKATIEDRGTSIGWNESYGDGQAFFSYPLNFRTDYWIFDGVVGNGADSSSYGFAIFQRTTERRVELIGIPALGQSSYDPDYITISHVAMSCPGARYDIEQSCIYGNAYANGATGIVISHNYMNNAMANMLIRNWDHCTIQFNYFAGNWSSPAQHGEQISQGGGCDYDTLRHNIFYNSQSYVCGVHKDHNYRWLVYNNIVIDGPRNVVGIWGNADSSTDDVMIDWEIHHNTHIGGRLSYGIVYVGNLSSPDYRSKVYNNISYLVHNPTMDNGGDNSTYILHDYNSFYNCTGEINIEQNREIDAIHPFVDSENGDYHLNRKTDSGLILPYPFNLDFDGVKRGLDNIWDRGAYEYDQLHGNSLPSMPNVIDIKKVD